MAEDFEPIPAIDLKGGKCVRLQEGVASRSTEYGSDPVAMALYWEAQGATRLHLVDLDGGVDPGLVLRYFEFHSLACSGYLPELWECALCHRILEATTNYFSPAAAGLLCPDCRGKEGLDRPASVDCVKVLRFFAQNECPAAARLKLKTHLAREIEDLMQGYVTYVLDREVASAKWLRQLRADDEQTRRVLVNPVGGQPPVGSEPG